MHPLTRTTQTGMRTVRLWLESKPSANTPRTGVQLAASTGLASKTLRMQLIIEITSGENLVTWIWWHFLVTASAFQWSTWIFEVTQLDQAPQHSFGSFRTRIFLTSTALSLVVPSSQMLALFPVKTTLVSIILSTASSVAPQEMMRQPSGGSVDTWISS